MSLCNLVSRIMFKEISWKQRESKLLSHALYEKNLPAYDYPHETIQMQSSPVLSQPQPRKKMHELHSINCRKKLQHKSPFLQKPLPASPSSWLQVAPDKSPRFHLRSLLLRPFPSGAAQAERMQLAWWLALWSVLPPRDGVSSLCPLHAEGLTPEATFSKQLQNVKSESSESAKSKLKELNNKNPL